MNLEEAQARVKAKIWQAIAQEDVDTKQIPKETLQALVDLTTNAALVEIDEEIGESLKVSNPKMMLTDDGEEEILWEGRPFLSLATRYVVTNERIRIIEGLLGKERIDIELVRIQDLDQTQTFRERVLNLGDIVVRGSDKSHPEIILNNVANPQEVHEILRRAVLKSREKYRLSFREEM